MFLQIMTTFWALKILKILKITNMLCIQCITYLYSILEIIITNKNVIIIVSKDYVRKNL